MAQTYAILEYLAEEGHSFDEKIELDIRLKKRLSDEDNQAVRDVIDTLQDIANNYREVI